MKKKETKEEEKNIIGRVFDIILYNEDGPVFFDYISKLENLCIDNGYSYYYITHDKDIKEDGTPDKVHTHYLIYTNGTTTTLDHIASEVGLPKNKIQRKNYLTSSIKYLTHESSLSQDKQLYDWHDILSNDMNRVNKIYQNMDENTYMREFKKYIDTRTSIIYYSEFVDYVLKENLWSFYRRSASIVKLLIDEHNNEIREKYQKRVA